MNNLMQKKPIGERNGPGIVFLLIGIGIIIVVCLGYVFVPYARYGGDQALEPWQMWGVGIILIFISIGGVIRKIRTAKYELVLTTTLKKKMPNHGLESTGAPPAAGTPETHP